MPYVRITIALRNGGTRSGVRRVPEPIVLEDVRMQSWHLAAEALGRGAIDHVVVSEVSADDPAVVALILGETKKNIRIPISDGQHPYVKQQQHKPSR